MQGARCASARCSSPAPPARPTLQSSCSTARSTGELFSAPSGVSSLHHPRCLALSLPRAWTPALVAMLLRGSARVRGMVDVIAKLQEAARKAQEAAARLEAGDAAEDEEEGGVEDAALEDAVEEEEADDGAPVQAETAPGPCAAAEAPAGDAQEPALLIDFLIQPGRLR